MLWSASELGVWEDASCLAEVAKVISYKGGEKLAKGVEECNWPVGFRFLVGQFTWFLEDHCNGLFPFGGVGFKFKDCSKYEVEVSEDCFNTFL